MGRRYYLYSCGEWFFQLSFCLDGFMLQETYWMVFRFAYAGIIGNKFL